MCPGWFPKGYSRSRAPRHRGPRRAAVSSRTAYWRGARRGSVRRGGDLRALLGGVLGVPFGRRRAEAVVVDVLGDRGVLATHGALGIAAELDLAERRVERVEQEITADERLARPEQQLQRLVGLERSDNAGQHAEDSGLRTRRRELRWRRCREEAAVARTLMRAEDRELSLEAIDAPVHDRLVPLHRRVVQQVARREVVGAVDDHVVVGDDPVDVVARESLLVRDHRDIGVECFERLLRGERLRLSDALGAVQDLSLEVRRVDDVGVDDAQRADAGRREVVRGGRSETAGADEEHLAAQELVLSGLADLRDQQVTAVALCLLRREGLRCDRVHSRILPAVEPAGHRNDVGVAELLQGVRGHRRANATRAVEDGGLGLVGDAVLGPLLEEALWDVHRARNVTRVPLVLLAHIRELDVRGAQQIGDLLRGRFLDALLDLGEVVAIRGHGHAPLSRSLNRPHRSEIPNCASGCEPIWSEARGEPLLRHHPVPLSPGPRDPRRRRPGARRGGRARHLPDGSLARGGGDHLRRRAGQLGRARDPLRRHGRHQQRAEGRLRDHRRARGTPHRALGRPRRPRRRGPLLQRLCQPGGALPPRADERLGRPPRERAAAPRVRRAARALVARHARGHPRRARRARAVLMRGRAGSLKEALEAHRARVERANRVRNATQLVAMVDAVGFCFAFTGEKSYPVPACFDHLSTSEDGKKWEWMWPWKDELAEAKKLYYGKLLVKKPTFVSMKMLPTFYATFGRAGDTDDHLDDVRAGKLSDLGRRVVEYLQHHGETQKKRMRVDLGIESKEGRNDLERAIEELQRLMYVARVKAVGERSDDYNYTYDLFVHRYPETVKAAERLSSADPTVALLRRLLELAGGVTPKQVQRLFDWENHRTEKVIDKVATDGGAVHQGGLLVLPELAR